MFGLGRAQDLACHTANDSFPLMSFLQNWRQLGKR